MLKHRVAATATAMAAIACIMPAGAAANHHACPVVTYQPSAGGGYENGVHYAQTGGNRVEATWTVRQDDGSTAVRGTLHSPTGSHIILRWASQGSPGRFSVARSTCTPVFVPYPIGGPKSPAPAGASFPVPWLPVVPGFATPTLPDLGAGGDVLPPIDPLGPLGPDLSPLRPQLFFP